MLSIGVATLLLSVVERVLLSPLPYPSPDQLVAVYLTNDDWRHSSNELMRGSWDTHSMGLDHVEVFGRAAGPIEGVSGYSHRRLPLDGVEEMAGLIMVDGDYPPRHYTFLIRRHPTHHGTDVAGSPALTPNKEALD